MGIKGATKIPLARGNSSYPAWVHSCASASCSRDGSSNPLRDALRSFSFASVTLYHCHGKRDYHGGTFAWKLEQLLGLALLGWLPNSLCVPPVTFSEITPHWFWLCIIIFISFTLKQLCNHLVYQTRCLDKIILFSSFQMLCSQKMVTFFKGRHFYYKEPCSEPTFSSWVDEIIY